jgi:glycosyltransferase involved in cell wall biosynthesis
MTARPPSTRVAQLVEALDSGGAEALAVEIANELAARGHDARMIVMRSDGRFQGRLAPSVRLHDLVRPRRDGSQAGRVIYFLESARRLEALIRRERIDVVQCHLPKANFLGLLLAVRRACRVLVTVHNNREFDYGDNAGALKQRLRRASYRAMLRHCDTVVAVSEQVRASLMAELGVSAAAGRRLVVVPNGVRVRDVPTAAERTAARQEWGIAADEVLVVGVGRLTAQKDFAALLRALTRLPAGVPAWRCVIAGEGEQLSDLERLAGDLGLDGRLRLAGLVPDVPGLLRAADVFCLPSRYEGLPLVLLEALAAGLPVASFAIAGVAEIVEDGVQARLAAPGDETALATALAELMADRDLRARLGAAGRRLVESRYGFSRMLGQLESLYGVRGPAPAEGDEPAC